MSVSQAPTLKEGLTSEEKKCYSQLFKSLDNEGLEIITGEQARSTFEKTGLPPAILGQIWQLADQNNTGFLTQFGFCVAMRLVGHVQGGKNLSPTLADHVAPLPRFSNMPLKPQSTNQSINSFQSQSSSHLPVGASPQLAIPNVSQPDVLKFSQLFNRSTNTGELSGDQARSIFLKAKLPTPILGQIWGLVDVNNLGKLDVQAFIIAMHLIQGLLSGTIKQLPLALPQSLWDSVSSANSNSPIQQQFSGTSSIRQTSSSSTKSTQSVRHQPDWVVTPQMKRQYDSIFDSLDTSKKGILQPDQVAGFLMKSNLNQEDLATVWDLADIQNTGIFGKLEFSIALYLVNRKIQGGELLNVVPDSLINSIKSPAQPSIGDVRSPSQNMVPVHVSSPAQLHQVSLSNQNSKGDYQQSKPSISKSSLDDLVGIFGSNSNSPASSNIGVSPGASSAPVGILPKVRKVPTGTQTVSSNYTGNRFVPSSSFGQTLVKQQEVQNEPPSLLGDDAEGTSNIPKPSDQQPQQFQQSQQPQQPQSQHHPVQVQIQPQQHTISQIENKSAVNYEALRSVPPPPMKKTTSGFQAPVSYTQNQSANDDLLADSNPEISGKLSQATTDIANISNQIKSLTSQTTTLQEKKGRAESELSKILALKTEIESKLNKLRTAYATEVSQVQEVENSLKSSREETEGLRSESSIAEAKFNQLQTDIQAKQAALESSQKENSSLKEKLGFMNAETVELEKQLEKVSAEKKNLKNQLAIKKSQIEVAENKNRSLRANITSIEEENHVTQQILSAPVQIPSSSSSDIRGLVDEVKSNPSQDMTGIDDIDETSKTSGAPLNPISPSSYNLGNENVNFASPSRTSTRSMSGNQVLQHSGGNPFFQADQPILFPVNENSGFGRLPIQSPPNNFAPSTVTDQTLDTATNSETPSSSPPTSDFQYVNTNYGMGHGTPGVPTAIQRTESLTSSVQNNAAMSVRDDNVDDMSEHDAPSEKTATVKEVLNNDASASDHQHSSLSAGTIEQQPDRNFDETENDKNSSGVESFEIVNAEDSTDNANSTIKDNRKPVTNVSAEGSSLAAPALSSSSLSPATATDGTSTVPGSLDFEKAIIENNTYSHDRSGSSSYLNHSGEQGSRIDEEFPPIKELEYEESSSSDESVRENDSNNDEFDDAFDQLPTDGHKTKAVVEDSFSKEFENLAPANDDDFAEEFDNLKVAKEENDFDFEQPQEQNGFDAYGNFESGSFYNEANFSQQFSQPIKNQQSSQFPAFNQSDSNAGAEANDEWEQLFAGFGNAEESSDQLSHYQDQNNSFSHKVSNYSNVQQPQVPNSPQQNNTPHSLAIEELVGMGFDKSVAIDALQKHKFDLEAATNYLLDNS